MYELIYLLSNPAFGSLHFVQETVQSAAAHERAGERRPRVRMEDALLSVRFGEFRVRFRHVPGDSAMPNPAGARGQPRAELARHTQRFEMDADADPQLAHLDDVLWLVTTVATIPGVIVVDPAVRSEPA